jgi:RNA polymerase sigma factor (sigma-70 family)
MRPPASDADRFREVFDRLYPAVWSYCRRRLAPAEVDDAVAEVFATAWKRWVEVPGDPATLPWLYRAASYTVAHAVRGRYRRDRLHQRLSVVTRAGAIEDVADIALDDDVATVVAAVNQLSDADRELVRLLAWEQLGYDEIAVVLDCTSNAVAIRVHRMRKRLDGILKSNEANGNSTGWQVTKREVNPSHE